MGQILSSQTPAFEQQALANPVHEKISAWRLGRNLSAARAQLFKDSVVESPELDQQSLYIKLLEEQVAEQKADFCDMEDYLQSEVSDLQLHRCDCLCYLPGTVLAIGRNQGEQAGGGEAATKTGRACPRDPPIVRSDDGRQCKSCKKASDPPPIFP